MQVRRFYIWCEESNILCELHVHSLADASVCREDIEQGANAERPRQGHRTGEQAEERGSLRQRKSELEFTILRLKR